VKWSSAAAGATPIRRRAATASAKIEIFDWCAMAAS
jgi:hypothetical protein